MSEPATGILQHKLPLRRASLHFGIKGSPP